MRPPKDVPRAGAISLRSTQSTTPCVEGKAQRRAVLDKDHLRTDGDLRQLLAIGLADIKHVGSPEARQLCEDCFFVALRSCPLCAERWEQESGCPFRPS